MPPQDEIMKYQTTLPVDFDGIFRFTNWTEDEFVGTWNKKEYHFPARTTSPMIMPEHSPLEIQHIRKKFARDLAEQEFFKGERYKSTFLSQERNSDGTAKLNSMHSAGQYTLGDLAEGIQKCLEPLEVSRASVTIAREVPLETKLTTDDEGSLNTVALDKKADLRARALEGKGLPQPNEAA